MTKYNENASMVNNSNHIGTSAHDTRTTIPAQEMCIEFIRFVRKHYGRKHGLLRIRFKKLGDSYHFRAYWKKRSLWAHSPDPEQAMAKFLLEISRKLFLEHYYPTEEFNRIKDLLQQRIIFRYSVKELN